MQATEFLPITYKQSIDIWPVYKVQQETGKALAVMNMTVIKYLAVTHPGSLSDITKLFTVNKHYFAQKFIKSPKGLAHSIAEFHANVLGSKAEIVGSDNNCSVIFERFNLLSNMIEQCNLSGEQLDIVMASIVDGLEELGKQFGYKAEVMVSQHKVTARFHA